MANKMRLKARFRLRWMQGCTVSRKKTSSHLFDQEENKLSIYSIQEEKPLVPLFLPLVEMILKTASMVLYNLGI